MVVPYTDGLRCERSRFVSRFNPALAVREMVGRG